MAKHILKTPQSKRYTMQQQTEEGTSLTSHPPKYSPEDKYGKYRRETKEEEYREKGLLN